MSAEIKVKPVVKIRPTTGKPSAASPALPWFAVYENGVPSQCRFADETAAWKEHRRFLTEGPTKAGK